MRARPSLATLLATTRLSARSPTDACGNSTSASQTITVEDATAPELSIPADYTAECSDELTLDDATATDNCGEVTIEVSEETAGDCDGSYVDTVPATDDAGNSTSATQTMRLRTQRPSSDIPSDYGWCSDAMPMDDASASDNCSDVSITVRARPSLATLLATTRLSARSCDGRLATASDRRSLLRTTALS